MLDRSVVLNSSEAYAASRSIKCPNCGALPGEYCISEYTGRRYVRWWTHTSRRANAAPATLKEA